MPCGRRWALLGRRMPRGPGPASEVAAPLQSRLVCIMGEVLSKLLLLSAPFPSKNGQRPPSSQWTDFLEQSTDPWVFFWGFFCCLVNTRLALIRPLCVVYLTPLWGDLLPGLWDRRISEPLRVW